MGLAPISDKYISCSRTKVIMADSTAFEDLEKGTVSYHEHASSSREEMITGVHTINPKTSNRSTCAISGDGKTVYLGGMVFDRDELAQILPYSTSDAQSKWRPLGNPVPIGLIACAISTFTLGLILWSTRGVSNPKVLLSSALCFSGFGTMVAGFWCLLLNESYAATSMAPYGGLYMSFAIVEIDAFGVVSGYATVEEFNNAYGIWLLGWSIYSFSMWTLTWKGRVDIFLVQGTTFLYLTMLSVYYFTGNVPLANTAGFFCTFSALISMYAAWSMLATGENSHVVPPVWMMPGHNRKAKHF